MSSIDTDMQGWRHSWQNENWPIKARGPSVPDLRRHVARETRLVRLGLLAPVAVTLGFGGSIGWRALQSGEAADVSLAVGVWFFIAFAWAGSMWIARGTWAARDESTAAFIDLSVARCDSWLHSAPFSIVLYLGELVFVLSWCVRYMERSPWDTLTAWPAVVVGWIGLPAFVLLLAGLMRRKRAQREYLLGLQRQLAGG